MVKMFFTDFANKTKAWMLPKIQCPLKLALEDGNELIALDLRWNPAKYIDHRLSLAILEVLFFLIPTMRPSGVSHFQGLVVCSKIWIIPGYARRALQFTLQKGIDLHRNSYWDRQTKSFSFTRGFCPNPFPFSALVWRVSRRPGKSKFSHTVRQFQWGTLKPALRIIQRVQFQPTENATFSPLGRFDISNQNHPCGNRPAISHVQDLGLNPLVYQVSPSTGPIEALLRRTQEQGTWS